MKDIRSLLYLTEPVNIMFKDENSYKNFCDKIKEDNDIIPLSNILTYLNEDNNFDMVYDYGWTKSQLIHILENINIPDYPTDIIYNINITLPVATNCH